MVQTFRPEQTITLYINTDKHTKGRRIVYLLFIQFCVYFFVLLDNFDTKLFLSGYLQNYFCVLVVVLITAGYLTFILDFIVVLYKIEIYTQCLVYFT